MFDKMKQLYDMQKKARALQQQLEAIKIGKTNKNGTLKVALNGSQKMEAVTIDPSWLAPDKKSELESALCQLINEGLAEVQKSTATQAAELMKELKGLNIPGLG